MDFPSDCLRRFLMHVIILSQAPICFCFNPINFTYNPCRCLRFHQGTMIYALNNTQFYILQHISYGFSGLMREFPLRRRNIRDNLSFCMSYDVDLLHGLSRIHQRPKNLSLPTIVVSYDLSLVFHENALIFPR